MKYIWLAWSSFLVLCAAYLCLAIFYPYNSIQASQVPSWFVTTIVVLSTANFAFIIPLASFLGAFHRLANYKRIYKFLLSILFAIAHTIFLYGLFMTFLLVTYGEH